MPDLADLLQSGQLAEQVEALEIDAQAARASISSDGQRALSTFVDALLATLRADLSQLKVEQEAQSFWCALHSRSMWHETVSGQCWPASPKRAACSPALL